MATDFCIDGNYLRAEAMGDPRWEWPFRNNRDRVSTLFEQDYWQTKATFVTERLGIEHPDLKGFYLIAESEPREVLAGVIQFTRTWSRIPAQQIVPGSRFITKPDLPGEFPQVSGNSLIVQPDESVPRWVFYTQKAVASDSGAPNGNSPTGGTYTITIGASTTSALAFNASATTIQTALNALPSVSARGSVLVTGTYTSGITISFNAYTAATLNTASMLPIPGVGAPQVVYKSVIVSNLRTMIFTMQAPNGFAFDSAATFTITVFGQTTAAIPVTGTLATVQAALEALSNVGVGGVAMFPNATHGAGVHVASGTNIMDAFGDFVGFQAAFTQQAISASGSSLTPVGSLATLSTVQVGNVYKITFTGVALGQRILYSAAHGISALDGIVLTQGANYQTIPPSQYSVTTDTIVLTAASGVAFTTTTLITFVGASTGSVYTGGNKLTRIKRVTDYYLPGVSVGVDTIDDIPLPVYEGDDATLLAAIFDGDTDINYEVGETEYYRDGPIVQITRTTLDASQL